MQKISKLTLYNIEALSLGAALLGSGGGSNARYNKLNVKYQIECHGEVDIKDVDELDDDALVIPVCVMGALIVLEERILSREINLLINTFMSYYKKKPAALMPIQIGGSNAFIPFLAAGKAGIPVIDGDFMGRAFPLLNMVSPNLYGMACSPAFFADNLGNTAVMHTEDINFLEKIARTVTVACGLNLVVSYYPMTGRGAKRVICRNSISYACSLGNTILKARKKKMCPIKALCEKHAQLLGEGIIKEIDFVIQKGFTSKNVTIEGRDNLLTVVYHEEYLAVYRDHNRVAVTPSIITVLDKNTGHPIMTESLSSMQKRTVSVLKLPAPAVWRRLNGLELVGPEAFNLPDKI